MLSSQTKAEQVFSSLRAEILSGRFGPGQRLRYADLCERYGTSMGVLREGMLRLSEQGLVRGEPQQGFQVTPLSAEDLRELTDARKELETLALRRAIVDGDVDWESRVLAAHHRLIRAPHLDPGDADRLSDVWVTAHADFHAALLDGCGNRRLIAIAAGLRDSSELYRRWSVPLGHEPDRDVAAEHAAILDAALGRDLERALLLLAGHIEHTTDILLASPVGQTISTPAEPAAGGRNRPTRRERRDSRS